MVIFIIKEEVVKPDHIVLKCIGHYCRAGLYIREISCILPGNSSGILELQFLSHEDQVDNFTGGQGCRHISNHVIGNVHQGCRRSIFRLFQRLFQDDPLALGAAEVISRCIADPAVGCRLNAGDHDFP